MNNQIIWSKNTASLNFDYLLVERDSTLWSIQERIEFDKLLNRRALKSAKSVPSRSKYS